MSNRYFGLFVLISLLAVVFGVVSINQSMTNQKHALDNNVSSQTDRTATISFMDQ